MRNIFKRTHKKTVTFVPVERALTMTLPWGSESICAWCSTYPNCSFYKKDVEIKVQSAAYPFPLKPTQLIMIAQIAKRPVPNERVWDQQKLKNQFPKKTIWKER